MGRWSLFYFTKCMLILPSIVHILYQCPIVFSNTIRHQTYHTNLKIAAFAGLLPPEIARQIPKSTRSNWRHQDPSQYFGFDYEEFIGHIDVLKELSNCRTALKCARAVLRLCYLAKSLGLPFNKIPKLKNLDQKKRIVDTVRRLAQTLGLPTCLKLLGLSRSKFSTWTKNTKLCIGSPWGLCRKTHPNQLTKSEIRAIKQEFTDPAHAHWPSTSIAWHLINTNKIAVSVQTILRYARILGLTKRFAVSRKQHKRGSISAEKPNEVWHIDITHIRSLDQVKIAVSFVIDNYSRKILAYKIAEHVSWQMTVEVLWMAQKNFGAANSLTSTILISDGGCENDNHKVATCVDALSIKHIIAQRDVHFSNSVIEAWNKIFKYRYLFRKPLPIYSEIPKAIEDAVQDYNKRPHYYRNGLTPDQAYSGELFDKTAYHARIMDSIENRRMINQQSCPPCSTY